MSGAIFFTLKRKTRAFDLVERNLKEFRMLNELAMNTGSCLVLLRSISLDTSEKLSTENLLPEIFRSLFFVPFSIYSCYHEERCECRFPKPGLFFSARNDLGISLENSCALLHYNEEVEAAKQAGIPKISVIREGGESQADQLTFEEAIHDVARYLLRNS